MSMPLPGAFEEAEENEVVERGPGGGDADAPSDARHGDARRASRSSSFGSSGEGQGQGEGQSQVKAVDACQRKGAERKAATPLRPTLGTLGSKLSNHEQVTSELAAIREAQRAHEQILEETRKHIAEISEVLGGCCTTPRRTSSTLGAAYSSQSFGQGHSSTRCQRRLSASTFMPNFCEIGRRTSHASISMETSCSASSQPVTAVARPSSRAGSFLRGHRSFLTSSASIMKFPFSTVMPAGHTGHERERPLPVRLQLVSEADELNVDRVMSRREPEDEGPIGERAPRATVDKRTRMTEVQGPRGTRYADFTGAILAGPSAEGKWARRYRRIMMAPNSSSRLLWDALVIVAIVFSVVLFPGALVYLDQQALRGTSGFAGCAVHAADAVWLLNIFICLFTGFFSEGHLVLNPRGSAIHYARTWLFIDLLSAFPLIATPAGMQQVLACLAMMKLTRFLRILHLFSRLQREFRFSALLPMKVSVTVALLAHLMCCGWRFAQGEGDAESSGMKAGVDTWFHNYVQDAYWVLMTMTTVGYGDIAPTNTTARLYAIFAMLMSPIFFGTIVSGLTHVTKEIFTDPVETKVAKATLFMSRRGVSQPLQKKVEHNLRHHIHQEQNACMDPDLTALLSPTVQKELALELLSSTVLRFPLFRSAPYCFISELATSFAWMLCMCGDVVAEEGQLVQEALFVMHGRLHVDSSRPEALMRHRAKVTEDGPLVFTVGAWFGEACLFDTSATHGFSATALVDTEMATLKASEYHRIAAKYPRVAEQQKKLEQAIKEHRASLGQLAYQVHAGHQGRQAGRQGRSTAVFPRGFLLG